MLVEKAIQVLYHGLKVISSQSTRHSMSSPKHANLGLHFLYFTLGDQDLPSVAADSAVPGLNRNLAYMNKQLLPGEQVLAEFEKSVRVNFTHRRSLEEQSRTLAAQRDAALPRLVGGELVVQE